MTASELVIVLDENFGVAVLDVCALISYYAYNYCTHRYSFRMIDSRYEKMTTSHSARAHRIKSAGLGFSHLVSHIGRDTMHLKVKNLP